MLLMLLACKEDPVKAPATMEELVVAMLVDFATDAGDTAAEDLGTWALNHVDDGVESYTLSPLQEEDVDTLEHPDSLNLPAMLAMAIPARLDGNMDRYVATVPIPDQSFVDPVGYSKWDRTILVGTEAEFLAGGPLETTSDIVKKNLWIEIPYQMFEDYRWVSTSHGDVLISRSWIPEAGWAEDGENGVLGGFTVEIWVPDGDTMIWLTATWTMVEAVVGDDAFLYDQTVSSMYQMYDTTEAVVNGG